jgi:hypothetical protein
MVQLLLILTLFQSPDTGANKNTNSSPLASYSVQWNNAKYTVCNTAASANYMSDTEKQVIYILNLVRKDPALFCETVLKAYSKRKPEMAHYESSSYFASLVNTLSTMKPVDLLFPDSLCYVSAHCHAFNTGKTGYVGHNRTPECQRLQHFMGECCGYGLSDPLDIVIDLLIDEDIESLGHRNICLGVSYTKLGVSIQPHKEYGRDAVLDFY